MSEKLSKPTLLNANPGTYFDWNQEEVQTPFSTAEILFEENDIIAKQVNDIFQENEGFVDSYTIKKSPLKKRVNKKNID